ncbi:MAG: hypothetical protein ACI85E_000204 [Marinomonas primoryensis]
MIKLNREKYLLLGLIVSSALTLVAVPYGVNFQNRILSGATVTSEFLADSGLQRRLLQRAETGEIGVKEFREMIQVDIDLETAQQEARQALMSLNIEIIKGHVFIVALQLLMTFLYIKHRKT